MKRLLATMLALVTAAQVDARALFLVPPPQSANSALGISRLSEVVQGFTNTLGGEYDVASMLDAPQGATDALRDGKWWLNGIGVGTPKQYGLIVVIGDDKGLYSGSFSNVSTSAATGIATIRTTTANNFQWARPGMIVTGTGITGAAVVTSVDSLFQRMTVAGTTVYNAGFGPSWRLAVRPDSLTRSVCYPRVPIARFEQFMGTTSALTTSTTCSTGVAAAISYSAHHDSTVNVYRVGDATKTWKARQANVTSSPRDPRGWRPYLGLRTTRVNEAGRSNGNYDDPDPLCGNPQADFNNPDTVSVWAILNRDPAGAPLGGNAAPNLYAMVSTVNGTNLVDPGTVLVALSIADTMSNGALFGASQSLPVTGSVHIDDGWKRGDSRFGGGYGGIGVTDTAAFKTSIGLLAELGLPFVVGVECDSLGSVRLGASTTGDGRFYDQRWWAQATRAHYTPHCHAGLNNGSDQNRPQNNGTKFLRPLDVWGLSRTRYAFGSVDSLLAYGLTDYVNDVADSGATYWLNKRAVAMCDSVFGVSKVDGLVMPPGDDWTNFQIKHTRFRQHALGIDSVFAAALMSGSTGIRGNSSGNVVGSDDSTVTNNYGYYPTPFRWTMGLSAGYPGMPAWTPVRFYGQPCNVIQTKGYPTSASVSSWSHQRNNDGGEKFLMGLLMQRSTLGTEIAGMRAAYVLALHCSDLGSSGRYTNNEETRPQYYTIKYVWNAIRTANAYAYRGRKLVDIVYPEEVRP